MSNISDGGEIHEGSDKSCETADEAGVGKEKDSAVVGKVTSTVHHYHYVQNTAQKQRESLLGTQFFMK